MPRTVTPDVIFLSSDSEYDPMTDTCSEDSVTTTRRRKRSKRESESSTSGPEEIPKLTSIPPKKVFKEATSFSETPGPKNAPPPDAAPIAYFNLFFTPSLLETIVKETNRNANEFFEERHISIKYRPKSCMPTTVEEIRAFIAVLLEMGITRRPRIEGYWERGSRQIPWFARMLSGDRFQFLLRFFRLTHTRSTSEPGVPKCDPSARFDVLVKHANTVFRRHYTPNQQLCIDESSVDGHYHSGFPNENRSKRKIKIWMLRDSISKYSLAFFCYTGAKYVEDKNLVQKYGLGYTVVQKLLSAGDYLNKGYHLFTDNFYTSLNLAKDLLKQNTYLTGEIKPSKSKRDLADENILLFSFKDKKNTPRRITLISTKENTNSLTIKDFEHEKTKPTMIDEYNKYEGAIDEYDEMSLTNLNDNKLIPFWKKIVLYIFETMVRNSYILYASNTRGKKMSRLRFTTKIIHELEKEWLHDRNAASTEPSKKIGFQRLPKSNAKLCTVCSCKNVTKRSEIICPICKKGLHPVCAIKHKCRT